MCSPALRRSVVVVVVVAGAGAGAAGAAALLVQALDEGEFRPLDMELTLEENGVKDLTEEFAALSIDPDEYIPVVHVYFNDDLTSA